RVMVRKSDIDNIFLAFDAKRPVELEIEMEQKFLPGPRKNAIVVAEILGTEKPDEVVIVGGHLDTWDGPGSQGALDNGTGTCVAIDAARILFMAKAKPKRTIRFILWTGEEQGLFGSRWYVEAHKAELSKISAVFIDDGGTNYQGGLTCTPEMEPMLKQAQAPLAGVFPELPFVIRTAARIPAGGGSDHAPFNAVGVPGFFWFETGRSDYNFVHHTQHDRVDKAIPEYLVQSSTNSAIMTYNLACAASLLPRNPIPGSTGGGG
ncbi:MAG: M20/M25/M40 family metallo-hydrolase, partial [Fimbriimonadaceae bacterium]